MSKVSVSVLRRVHISLISILFFVVAYMTGWASIDVRSYIDIETISVSDANIGEAPKLVVDRSLHKNFNGGYIVTIRSVDRNLAVCSSGYIHLPYEMNEGPINNDLLWWAAGGGCSEALLLRQEAGTYTVKTCHFVKPYWFYPKKELCWMPLANFSWI